MEDKKNSLYSLSNKMKNGWSQGGYSNSTSVQEAPEPQLIPQIVIPPVNEDAAIGIVPITQIPVMPEPVIPVMPVMPVMPPSMRKTPCTILAMATMVEQNWEEIYDDELGFERGTIFPELDLPFVGEGACKYE